MFKKKEKKVKSREERFKIVASRRVQDILNKMSLLRNCADRANYAYTEEQVKKIISSIEEEWKLVRHEFNKHKSKKREFKL